MADDQVKRYVFDQETVEAQRCAAKGNWTGFKEIFVKEGNKQKFLEPFDLFGNTAIHAVARSGKATLFKELMEMLDEPNQRKALKETNLEGNTLLHEAIFCEDVEMVDIIMEFGDNLQIGKDQLLLEPNSWNETPVFRAAKHGKLKILKHIHTRHIPLEANHFPPSEINGLHHPILHYCLLRFKFGVAIWLVNKVDNLTSTTNTYWMENESTGKIVNGFTCFQLLCKMPMAFRSTDTREMGMIKKLVYYLLPEEGYVSELELTDAGKNGSKSTRDTESGQADDEGNESVLELDDAGKNPSKSTRDMEGGQADDEIEKPSKSSFSSLKYYSVWKHVAEAFNCIQEIWKQKKQHMFAEHVAKLLVNKKENSSCMYYYRISDQALRLMTDFPSNVTVKKNKIELTKRVNEEEKIKKNMNKQISKEDQANEDNIKSEILWETPLFLAAASGIIEVVKMIVVDYPEAISHVNRYGLNILHMAIKHRQLEIYEFIEESSAFKALVPRICGNGRTILHQAASMEYYREQVLPGVAYQLQDELEWYHRVRSKVPKHYLMHCDNKGLTAGDLLDIEHAEMHDQAKQWMKETAQSCSTVAVLIAGVVFAAAYAIPGGTERGQPVLHNSPAFRIFTIMDVVALAGSLGSVVMFLSILTSSFDLWDFHKSLPRKLRVGFIMLFCSLITTMLAFAATILLTIRMEGNNKRTTFIYSLAFVFVSMFGLTQFPIYKMFGDVFKQCSKYWKKKSKCWKKKT